MRARTIVVGMDGSRSARDALRWALDEARGRGTTVEAVHVWQYPALSYAAIMASGMSVREDLEDAARALLDHEVDAVLATELCAPAVARVVLEGDPGDRLAHRATAAELLVVGHRRRGGLSALLPGSVGQHCAAHAVCPVVVVTTGHVERRRAAGVQQEGVRALVVSGPPDTWGAEVDPVAAVVGAA